VNKLLKQFDDMSTMMKRMNKLGQKGLMRHGLSALMPRHLQQQGGGRGLSRHGRP
jgi:signal recognition particle subunit SRP54